GEANKLLYLFTPEFGRCLVLAQGVRQEKSKLRPNLVDYNFGHFSLVRGREFWRLVSAEKDSRFTALYQSAEKQLIVANLFNLLAKILVEEEDSQIIFEDLVLLCQTLIELPPQSDLIPISERLFLLRLIKHLGYWPNEVGLTDFVLELLKNLAEPALSQQATKVINHFFTTKIV
ncbi:MAG: hypothetical protein CO035_04815, partial [Candidatus Omnitrophica bacterium CG_4_9_14_0_2_um_filter_42_8]